MWRAGDNTHTRGGDLLSTEDILLAVDSCPSMACQAVFSLHTDSVFCQCSTVYWDEEEVKEEEHDEEEEEELKGTV